MKYSQSLSFLFTILVVQFALISQTTASPTSEQSEIQSQVDLPKVNVPVVIDAFVPNSTLADKNLPTVVSLQLCPLCYEVLQILQQLQIQLKCATLTLLNDKCSSYNKTALLNLVLQICLDLKINLTITLLKDGELQYFAAGNSSEIDSVAGAKCTNGCLSIDNLLQFLGNLCLVSTSGGCGVTTLVGLVQVDLNKICNLGCCCYPYIPIIGPID